MTVTQSAVKKRVVVVRKSSVKPSSKQRPTLPAIPSVTQGPRTYGRTMSGLYIIPRFYVTRKTFWPRFRGKPKKFWVFDVKEERIALGTKEEGYSTKEAAEIIAKKYCKEFGAWATSPF